MFYHLVCFLDIITRAVSSKPLRKLISLIRRTISNIVSKIMFCANIAAHQEALRREIERLRKVYQEQNLKGVENGAPPQSEANNGSMEKEQLAN